jgi:hypothetical protein
MKQQQLKQNKTNWLLYEKANGGNTIKHTQAKKTRLFSCLFYEKKGG